MTGAAFRVGIEGAHVQQPRYARLSDRAQHCRCEFDMRAFKSGAIEAALIEYADQIDDVIAAIDAATKEVRVVDVAGGDFDTRQRLQVIAVAAGACQHADRMAGTRQSKNDLLADKAGAAGNADDPWPLDYW